MSKENLIKLLESATADEQLRQQLQSASSYEDLKNLARTQGFDLGDLSEEEAARTIGVATGEIKEELTDDELEMVAGGGWDEGVAAAMREQKFRSLAGFGSFGTKG